MRDDRRTAPIIGGRPPARAAQRTLVRGKRSPAHALADAGLANLDARNPARFSADAAVAEEGVRLAYRVAGLSSPKVIWCRSPLEIAQRWSRALAKGQLGTNLKGGLFDQPSTKSLAQVARSALWRGQQIRSHYRVTASAITAAVLEEVGSKRPPLLSWICRAQGRWPQVARRPEFAAIGCGPDELNAASLLAYPQETADGIACDALHSMCLIAENAGWLVPYERLCWLSERPDRVHTDARGCLHSASGPALRYCDGWCRYFWKGVAVPAWIVDRPQDITLAWIDSQVDAPTRHAMIDIYTAERFVAEGGAYPVQRDASATLWRRTWTHRGATIDTWSAVELASGAGRTRRAFHPVPAGIRSPAEALSWLCATTTTIGNSRDCL